MISSTAGAAAGIKDAAGVLGAAFTAFFAVGKKLVGTAEEKAGGQPPARPVQRAISMGFARLDLGDQLRDLRWPARRRRRP